MKYVLNKAWSLGPSKPCIRIERFNGVFRHEILRAGDVFTQFGKPPSTLFFYTEQLAVDYLDEAGRRTGNLEWVAAAQELREQFEPAKAGV